MITNLISAMAAMLAAEPTEPAACQQNLPEYCDVTSDVDVSKPISESLDFTIDPRAFFDQLVLRYRGIAVYRDVTRVIQITQYSDNEEPQRVETEVESSIKGDSVSIRTPSSQLRRGFGLAIPIRISDEMDSARQSYELWLLPHLTLKLTDEPLKEFREGVPEGFTATEAASVTMDDRPMVHLELKSGDGLSEDSDARFDLFVDPDSMLIERIQGEQRLPDGRHYETTLEIEPRHVEARSPETACPVKEATKPASDVDPISPGFGPTTSESGEELSTPSAWPDSTLNDQPHSDGSSAKGDKDTPKTDDEGHADAPPFEEDCPPHPNVPRKDDSSCESAHDDEQREPHKPRRSRSERSAG